MTTSARRLLVSAVLVAAASAATASAQVAYTDFQGREWRELVGTTNATWNAIANVAPTDGVTPIAGSVNGVNLSGWVWATRDQVTEVMAEFAPEIALTGTVGGPAYTLSALGFLDYFNPTFAFYTTFGGSLYVSGWTATQDAGSAYVPEASGEYPVFNGYLNTAALAATNTQSQYRGIWLYRQTPFSNVGSSLAGSNGEAVLAGFGSVTPGASTTLRVFNAYPSTFGLVAIGASRIDLPFLGGVFVPSLDTLISPLAFDQFGNLTLTGNWPAGIPSGAVLYAQAWFLDPGNAEGAGATNAVRIAVP
jgi:hypothetical protein